MYLVVLLYFTAILILFSTKPDRNDIPGDGLLNIAMNSDL